MMKIIFGKTLFQFLDMNKLNFLVLLICTHISCTQIEITGYEEIESYLIEEQHKKSLSSYDDIVVINEAGDCMNCNNSFSKAMAKHIDDESVLFLICTPGANVDISAYISDEKNNVILDYHNKFGKLNLVNHCAIIELGNEKIDTIIQIDLNNVQKEVNNIFP